MRQPRYASIRDTLTLDSDIAELARLSQFVEAFCVRAALGDEIHYHLDVVLEELIINTVKHGKCDPLPGAIHLTLEREGDRLQISYSDNGLPFDPLHIPPPNLNQDLMQRPIGGLGIHLVRCLMPDIRYERRNGRNYLLLAKRIEHQAELTLPNERGANANRDGNRSC